MNSGANLGRCSQVLKWGRVVGLWAVFAGSGVALGGPTDSCLVPAGGIVAWWPMEGDGCDVVGTNRAVLLGNPTFIPGHVGRGLQVDRTDDTVRVPASPASNLGEGAGFTIEFWVKPDIPNNQEPLIEWNSGQGLVGVRIWTFYQGGPACVYADVIPVTGGAGILYTGPGVLVNVFQHVALTYDRELGLAKIFVNGQAMATRVIGSFIPETRPDVYFGRRPGQNYVFGGVLDEVTFYNRALSASEIQAIVAAARAGKCRSLIPPSIVRQPLSLTVFAGDPASFDATVAGDLLLSYQWFVDGQPLASGTNSALRLPAVQSSDSGSYAVRVTNPAGSALSSNAALTVQPPPTCVPPPSGLVACWPLELGGDALVGTNQALLVGHPAFVPAKVGYGMQFDATDDSARIVACPATDLGAGAGFTVECWVQPGSASSAMPLVEWNDGVTTVGLQLWTSVRGGPGCIFASLPETSGAGHWIASPSRVLSNAFAHVALSYDRSNGTARIFLNGQEVASGSVGSVAVETRFDVYLGHRPQGGLFAGVLDEVSFYNRALDAAEIAQLAGALHIGKCRAPMAPTILQSPRGATVFATEMARFDVEVVGSGPLTYQWWLNDAPLASGTNRILVLTNVQPSQAGDFFVVVTNEAGSATSSVAGLTVNPVPGCVLPPAGLVAWWSLEADAADIAGANHGVLLGVPSFAPGRVGQGLLFDKVDDAVRVPASPALNLGLGSGFTIELWVKPTDPSPAQPLVEWNDGIGILGLNLWLGATGPGAVVANLVDNLGCSHVVSTAPWVVTNTWAHVALTYGRSNGVATIFVNGSEATNRALGSFTVETRWPVHLGRRPLGTWSEYLFGGILDEISIYSRALTAQEIAQIAGAAWAGKCPDTGPPRILETPRDLTVFIGDPALLSVAASGVPPLRYQWFFNGGVLSNATAASLFLNDVQLSQAGLYSVAVSNLAGLTTSSNAVLTVLTGASCITAPTGLAAWWPLQFTGDDWLGSNRLALQGNPAFVSGRAGIGLQFDGRHDAGRLAASLALNLGAGSGFTLEFWVKPTDGNATMPFIEWNNSQGAAGVLVWSSVSSPGSIYFNVADTGGAGHTVITQPRVLSNAWAHVAATYDRGRGLAEVYLNGEWVTNQIVGRFTPETRYDVFFGWRPPVAGPQWFFNGTLDEVSFYSRALSATEIRSIFGARDAGKCRAIIPPTIVRQPGSVALFLEETAQFEVAAIGDLPLGYEWQFNGNPLPAHTNSTLVLSNVQFNQAGDYRARVSNAGGAVTSSVATLAVRPISPCVAPPPALVAWWPLDGDGQELVAGNHVALLSNPVFTRGKVGQGMQLDGWNDAGRVPASPAMNIGFAPGLTIELWAEPFTLATPCAVIEWNNGLGSVGVHLWFSVSSAGGGAGSVFANVGDVYGTSHVLSTPPGVLTNRLQHVALTYDRGRGLAQIFVQGQLKASNTFGSFPLETHYDVNFGRRPTSTATGSEGLFPGILDEVCLYSRALSQAEIVAITEAGPAGKCRVPLPPAIVQHPESTALFEGSDLRFIVRAVGLPPLTYQWLHHATPLVGRTNAALILSNLQLADAGDYSVVVTGPTGTTTSSNAALVVYPVPNCVAPPFGVVSWWPLDGTADDLAGGSPGMVVGDPLYPAGLVGQVMSFDGLVDAVRVPASSNLNVGAGPGFSMELWVNPADGLTERPLLEWNNRLNNVGVALWISTGNPLPGTSPGSLFANLIDTTDVAHRLMSPNGVIVQGRWQHVALTWDKPSGVATLYRDAVIVAQANLGSFTPQTGPPFDLFLGWRYGPQNSGYHFIGLMDEVTIYNRVLTSSEIESIYRAHTAGKCKPVEPPSIAVQPQSLMVFAGEAASFNVGVSGTAPFTFLWRLNGTPIPSATNGSLFIATAGSVHAGEYSVVVANAAGAVTSQVARLTVAVDRTLAARSPSDQPPGGLAQVPVELRSQGDVGGMTFLLHYHPDYLSGPEVTWGPALTDAVRELNVPTLGTVRAVFALPAGAVPAGTQTLAVVSFRARAAPFEATSELRPEVVDVARPTGDPIPFGTDVQAGSVRVLPRGGLGDNNGTGRRDLGDVTLLLRLLAQLDTTRPWDISRNDFNLNGLLDSGDVVKLLRTVAGIEATMGAQARDDDPTIPKRVADAPPAAPAEMAALFPSRLVATNGQLVTVQVRLESMGRPVAGALFQLNYPPETLRLVNSQSVRSGPMVPADAVIVWSVAPDQTNFASQSGRVTYGLGSAVRWPTNGGVLAEFTFQVQPGATNHYLWPVTLSGVEVTSDGYDIRALVTSDLEFIGRTPVPGRLWTANRDFAVGFEIWLSGDAGATYTIEASSNLVDWMRLTNVVSSTGAIPIVDPQAAHLSQRFYRARPLISF
jgi:hypothetical protein